MSGAVARVAVERGADLGAITLRRDLEGALATAIRMQSSATRDKPPG
jgi:hypothetical protein